MRTCLDLLLLGTALALTGCAALDTNGRGPITIRIVDPDNSSVKVSMPSGGSKVTSKTAAEEGCRHLRNIRNTADVDTLYGRAMSNFNFKSPEQIQLHRKMIDRFYMVDQGYKHDKQAGAYYHLAQTVGLKLPDGERTAMWLEVEFSKNGKSADVSVEYCIDPRDHRVNTAAAQDWIEGVINSALFR